MSVQDITSLVSQLGFPVFVAGYMLIKQAKDTENMVNVLTKLQTTIDALSMKIEKSNG